MKFSHRKIEWISRCSNPFLEQVFSFRRLAFRRDPSKGRRRQRVVCLDDVAFGMIERWEEGAVHGCLS